MDNVSSTISTIIPLHLTPDVPLTLVANCFESLLIQNLKPYEVVIADDLVSDLSQSLVENFILRANFPVKYFKNSSMPGLAANTNFALRRATGDWVHFLQQDDCLSHENVYKNIVPHLYDENSTWLNLECADNHIMRLNSWQKFNVLGVNRLGGLSTLIAKRNRCPELEVDLKMMVDVDLYESLYRKFGDPIFVNDLSIAVGKGVHQTGFKTTSVSTREEIVKLIQKYDVQLSDIFSMLESSSPLELRRIVNSALPHI